MIVTPEVSRSLRNKVIGLSSNWFFFYLNVFYCMFCNWCSSIANYFVFCVLSKFPMSLLAGKRKKKFLILHKHLIFYCFLNKSNILSPIYSLKMYVYTTMSYSIRNPLSTIWKVIMNLITKSNGIVIRQFLILLIGIASKFSDESWYY